MTYTRTGDSVTLEMTVGDYQQLLLILGFALGAIPSDDKTMLYRWLDFVNRLNTGNPNYTPYEIPPKEEAKRPPRPPFRGEEEYLAAVNRLLWSATPMGAFCLAFPESLRRKNPGYLPAPEVLDEFVSCTTVSEGLLLLERLREHLRK